MDGVTILNTISVSPIADWVVTICMLIIAITLISTIIGVGIDNDSLIIGSGIIFGLAAIVCVFTIFNNQNSTTYEVLIDEDVSYTEFNARYEVISQRGDIFVIKERKEQ